MTRRATYHDYHFIRTLYFHPNINPYLLYEMEEEVDFPAIFDELMGKDLLWIFETDGIPKGMFKLIPLAHRTSHIAYLGGVAIHPDAAGGGMGKQMLLEIIELGRTMGLHRIELSTATFNEKAIRLYEKTGFQKEGVLRDFCWLKSENRYIDEVMMSYLYP
ncbi:MAG: GNAT family N-acetyltransferase [Saprospiraceae bacterium]|nr:GNAT family N-acetyltransferase [Saprospiraceae bacterium]